MPTKKRSTPKGGTKRLPRKVAPAAVEGALFDRVVGILEQARTGVVRAVNSYMVLAYWMIGREIVLEVQGGRKRADYGRQVLADLSRQLKERYGEGFSETNLKSFRVFYLAYSDRLVPIRHPTGAEFTEPSSSLAKGRPVGDPLAALKQSAGISRPLGVESVSTPPSETKPAIRHPAGDESLSGFSPQLSWSHYRALMRVEKPAAREFYEREAIAGGWDKRTLERQIHSFYYERLLKSQQPQKMLAEGRQTLTRSEPAIESLKNPYVLEFLGLPEVAALQESDLESAILSHLQSFLLELGKGFAFVARQKRMRFEEQDRYIDLVFYHLQLKFYLLIDLKMGKLSHGDVGQMDGYVRMFDDLFVNESDGPTIGLILCTEKDEVVAQYSVLSDRKQIFASKYMLYLPTEAELSREIERERRLIEEQGTFPNAETKPKAKE
ncbi:MAG TPA: PDDEXK nuclease domain-containing protein [Candidatus Limnocylindria bacterium]|jgi:predicted nuclease of restriction endonuclease-like (RecB) superfamily|nr:PDDEXK nuclease domain-containing protein [Candidatus Limnocylindria bacterium]